MHGIKHTLSRFFVGMGLLGFVVSGLVLANPVVASAGPVTRPIVAQANYSGDCKGSIEAKDCGITAYIVTFTQVLSGVVGIVVTIMIVWGGIKYSMSKDNPQETAAAKNTIRNALIALVFYFFTAAFLNYLIPGGIT